MNIFEGLRERDLQYLISNYISVDEYTSKIDEDNITVAFYGNDKDGINELKDFIEKVYFIEIRDIEVADTMTKDGKYILFVEFERNLSFPEILMDIIDTINNVTNNKDWKFKTFGNKNDIELNKENIKENVRLTKLRDSQTIEEIEPENETSDEVDENYLPKQIKINDDGWVRVYNNEGYVSEKKMNKIISESITINERDPYELELLENVFPEYSIIITDKNVFMIKNDKITMLE